MIQFRLTPCSSARREASSTTGPSATGSENGTPISITSAPLASSSSMMPQNVSSVGEACGDEGNERRASGCVRIPYFLFKKSHDGFSSLCLRRQGVATPP